MVAFFYLQMSNFTSDYKCVVQKINKENTKYFLFYKLYINDKNEQSLTNFYKIVYN